MTARSVTMLTVRDWAATLSMSRQAGYFAVRRCRIPVVDGLVDAEAATALYRANTRARARNRRPESDAPPAEKAADARDGEAYSEHRARRERAEADLRELELAERRGELVDIAAVRAELGARLAQLREQLLQAPARLAPLIAGEIDQAKVMQLLDGELRQILAAACAGDSSEAGA